MLTPSIMAARAKAPRAHAFADEIQEVLYGRRGFTPHQVQQWERFCAALRECGTTRNGITYAELNAADEAHYRAEFSALVARVADLSTALTSGGSR